MTDEVIIRHSGIAATQAALSNFVGDLRKTVRGSLRAASKPMRLAAQANAPVLKFATRRRVPGTLRRNIKIFNSKRANGRNGVIGVYLSVKASRKDLKRAPISGDPYYFRWVESGHKIVPRSKRIGTRYGKARYATTLRYRRGNATTFVEGSAYFLRAYRTHGESTIGLFTADVLKRVAKANKAK